MSAPALRRALALLLLVPLAAVAAQEPAATGEAGGAVRSPRNANYEIEVLLEPETRTLEGSQIVEWRNIQDEPTSELWFHLYWNAWRNNRSTWMRGDRIRGRSSLGDDVRQEDWSFLEVDWIRLLPGADYDGQDLTAGARFAAPDDGNKDDRTVWVVPLPRPVEPGETIRVELSWHAKVPRTFARTGVRGDYYFIAHWFPKLGVFEEGGWNCHQYHSATEYYSNYGTYDVRITLPERFVVGATGRLTERTEHAEGTVTHRYQQDDVHAFTWTASPDYLVREERFEAPGLPAVDMRLLLQPEHRAQERRHFDATRAALEHYGRWYGAYPYGHITVVDPAYGSGAGGMEYPTIFTCGTRLFNPFGGGSPEGVTIHEAGHQFWYGLVGNNEFEYAWLDEGLDTFSTARVYDEVYGERSFVKRYFRPPGTDQRGFLPLLFPEFKLPRADFGNRLNRFRATTLTDIPSTPTYLYFPATAGAISYHKTAMWLATLERHLGWDTLRRILSTFFERWRFGHPRPEDFFAVAEEVAGVELGWFFDQVWDSAVEFDYAVHSVSSRALKVEGWIDGERGLEPAAATADDNGAQDGNGGPFRSEVVVRRDGDGVFPVDVLMVFEDGSEVRRSWDGRGRWKLFAEERDSKLAYAVVDPERVLLMDLYPSNNSRLREPAPELPAAKWAARWMVWLQDLLMTFSFFA